MTSPYPTPFAAPAAAELAARFSSLEIIELLGQGGMGAVYKARQLKLDRLVALKVLLLQAGGDAAFAERFAREARALAKLSHPSIVAVHDFGEAGGLYYFVMEFVDGVNLRQLLRAGPLEPPQALKIISQICEALQYAHDEGIVHRDIKPENILVDRRGRVKIADFGLAKLLGRTPVDFTLTGTHQVMGTPHYMAPEQMERSHAVDHRADIYSLGVVFYEMLTGELPLGSFVPPSQKVEVDARLDDVVLRALAREPERRYQHVSELRRDVESLTTGGLQAMSAAEAPVAMTAGEAARFSSIAFKISNVAGEPRGLIRFDGNALILEFEFKGFVGLFKSGLREKRIPVAEIESITLRNGWLGTALSIKPFSLSSLAGIPGHSQGRAKLHIARKDREAAEQLVAAAMQRLPLASSSRLLPTSRDEAVQRSRLRRLVGVTSIAAVICVLGAGASLVPWANLDIEAKELGAPSPMVRVLKVEGIRFWHGTATALMLLVVAAFLIAASPVQRLWRPLCLMLAAAGVILTAVAFAWGLSPASPAITALQESLFPSRWYAVESVRVNAGEGPYLAVIAATALLFFGALETRGILMWRSAEADQRWNIRPAGPVIRKVKSLWQSVLSLCIGNDG